jgi:hypothetical protein
MWPWHFRPCAVSVMPLVILITRATCSVISPFLPYISAPPFFCISFHLSILSLLLSHFLLPHAYGLEKSDKYRSKHLGTEEKLKADVLPITVLFQHLFRGKLSVWEQTYPPAFIRKIYLFIYCLFNETLICSEYTAPSITEDSNLHIHSCENFTFQITETLSDGGSIRSSLVHLI